MKNYRKILVIITIIFIISLISGIIYGLKSTYDITGYIENLDSKNILFGYHIIVIFVSFILSISLIGTLGNLVIFGFESISIGYVIGIFYNNYKLKGLLFGIVNVLINKLLYILILIYLVITSIKFFVKSVNNIVGIKKDAYKDIIFPIIQKYGLILIILMLYDLLLYFFSNDLLKYLFNML